MERREKQKMFVPLIFLLEERIRYTIPVQKKSTKGGLSELSEFIQQAINGLRMGSVYALVALGYTMVYGIIRLINFAHGDFIMVGAYTLIFTIPVMLGFGLPAWVAAHCSHYCVVCRRSGYGSHCIQTCSRQRYEYVCTDHGYRGELIPRKFGRC